MQLRVAMRVICPKNSQSFFTHHHHSTVAFSTTSLLQRHHTTPFPAHRPSLAPLNSVPNGRPITSAPGSFLLSKPDWLVSTPESCPVHSNYDAILVLGGGLLPDGSLPEWVIRRLDGALSIYAQQTTRTPILLLGAGTPHKPSVLDANGYVLHESTAYANYLLAAGVPAADLLKETSSYDTVGNGYFSLTMHALPAGWRTLSVCTSAFHMPRTQAIFNSCYSIAAADDFRLDYHPVSDDGLFSEEVLSARAVKEAAAVETWKKNVAEVHTLAELHRWLFATHLCYSVSRQHEFGAKENLDPKLAATY